MKLECWNVIPYIHHSGWFQGSHFVLFLQFSALWFWRSESTPPVFLTFYLVILAKAFLEFLTFHFHPDQRCCYSQFQENLCHSPALTRWEVMLTLLSSRLTLPRLGNLNLEMWLEICCCSIWAGKEKYFCSIENYKYKWNWEYFSNWVDKVTFHFKLVSIFFLGDFHRYFRLCQFVPTTLVACRYSGKKPYPFHGGFGQNHCSGYFPYYLSPFFRPFPSESMCVFVFEHTLVFPWDN